MLEFFTKILVQAGESPEFPLDFISPSNPYQNTSLIWYNGMINVVEEASLGFCVLDTSYIIGAWQ